MRDLWNNISDTLPVTEPAVVFAVVMVIILIAPVVMRRLRIPGLIGLIVAGAIVGEHGLNIIERDHTIGLLGTIGLLYLMFMVGLSMDLGQFQRTQSRSIGFGVVSFLIPQVAGIAVGMHLLGFTPVQAVLLGSIVGSHTLLAYPIIKRLGITRNRAVTTAMGGTIVTDALALTVLAGVVAVDSGDGGVGFWMKFLGMVGVFAIAVIFGLPIFGRWFFRTVRDRSEVDFVFLLVVLFVAASVSEWVGLAPIVGAFLAGLTMNRLVPDTGPLMSRVNFVGDALFIPFFLISVGMLVDVRVLGGTLDVWLYALAFTLLVVIGKGGAARLTQLFYKFRKDEGFTIAGLSIPQAAATLAVTFVGFERGIFDEVVVNAVVLLMLSSCLLGPWLVERYGREVAIADDPTPLSAVDAPQRILVPLANPATADVLMDLAFMLRQRGSQEPIYPLTVARDGSDVQAQVAAGEKLLSHAVVHAAAVGVPVMPITRVDYNVAQGVERAVQERRITTLIIGWNGRITSRGTVLGSILDQLLHSTQQVMLICHTPDDAVPLNTVRRVVAIVPRFVDREPGFREALGIIKTLAKEIGAVELAIATPVVAVERIESLAERTLPEIDLSMLPIPAGKTAIAVIEPELEKDDLILFMSGRPGRLSWTNDLGRMPRRLAQLFPEHNLLLLYPAEVAMRDVRTAHERRIPLLDPKRIVIDLEPTDCHAAIERLLKPTFTGRLHVLASVLRELRQNIEQISMQIAPGIVLLHRHVERMASPTVFIGVCQEGIDMPGAGEKAQVLIVLLSPADLPPEEHLHALAEIARMMNRKEIVEQLTSAKTPEDVIGVLTDNPSSQAAG